jgi:hypothetical protein
VLGVDTHKDVRVAAVITSLGVPLGKKTFLATAAGYRALLPGCTRSARCGEPTAWPWTTDLFLCFTVSAPGDPPVDV